MEKKEPVPSTIYTEDYFLAGNDGYVEYQKGLSGHIHPKFERALKYAGLRPGMNVLDLGCGRGDLSFYALQRGCRVTAVDYSEAAVKIAERTMASLDAETRSRLDLRLLDATGLNSLFASHSDPADRFDIVFMVDVVEHIHPWQLQETILHLKRLMKPGGMLFISTPNRLYEEYFYTVKKVLSLPFTALKMFFRVLRGKMKAGEFFPRVLRITVYREGIDAMHVNVMSPKEIRSYFPGWRVKIICDAGGSKSFLNLIAGRWFGPEMIVRAW